MKYEAHTFLIICFCGSAFFAFSDTARAQQATGSHSLLELDSQEGRSLLTRTDSSRDFFQLVSTFETQQNLAYCGVASSVMVLNASGVERPDSKKYGHYRIFTQDNFFNVSVSKIKSAEEVSRTGMTLSELAKMLEAHAMNVKKFHAVLDDADAFRERAATVVSDGSSFLVVNYLRSSIGQNTGGHISPIGAYDKLSDRVLVLDVARYKYTPVGVGVNDLWKAMRTSDREANANRGYLVVTGNSVTEP